MSIVCGSIACSVKADERKCQTCPFEMFDTTGFCVAAAIEPAVAHPRQMATFPIKSSLIT